MKIYMKLVHVKAPIIWLYSAQNTVFPVTEIIIHSLAKHWEISREIMT